MNPPPEGYDAWVEFARTATHGWHEEETKYPYDNPHFDPAWGHFSQMVWRNSTRLGCALGHCPSDVNWPGRFYCCEFKLQDCRCNSADNHRLFVLWQ